MYFMTALVGLPRSGGVLPSKVHDEARYAGAKIGV